MRMDGSLIWGLVRVVVVLLFIIPSVFYVTRWYAKKQMPEGSLKIKSALSLGQNKILYVIEWEGKKLLLGVTNQAISLLDQKVDMPTSDAEEVFEE